MAMILPQWNFKAKQTNDGRYLAWCARLEDLGEGPMDIAFDELVYFEFADTADEAIAALRRELGRLE